MQNLGLTMPQLIQMYIRNVAIGFLLAVAFTALLIWLNIGNLRHLVSVVQGGWLAVLMLVVFNTIVFGGVQFAIAVMRLGDDATPPRGRLGQHLPPKAIRVPVAERSPKA